MSENEIDIKDLVRKRTSKLITKIPKHKMSGFIKDVTESGLDPDEDFLPKGAFLLTTSFDVSIDRIASICEKIPLNGPYTLTKTATGILFKFSDIDDYQTMLRTGFHKVTGARFYRKVQIPCRPKKTFTIYVLDVPEEVPIEDIRHAMFEFNSVIEVVRLRIYRPATPTLQSKTMTGSEETLNNKNGTSENEKRLQKREFTGSVIRITLASLDEFNNLLQNGFNFFDATFFQTDPNVNLQGARVEFKQGMMEGNAINGRVRNLLPVFDSQGLCKLPAPSSKVIKPSTS